MMQNYKAMIMQLLDEITNEKCLKYLYVLMKEMRAKK